MKPDSLHVLYEDNHLLVVNKPAGVATMGTPADKGSLLEFARQYVKVRYAKPGNVYLGVVSRLDAPVTGALLLARTSKAARRLTEQFRAHQVRKTYWALVEGAPGSAEGVCEDYLVHDDRHRRMHVAPRDAPGAKLARLFFRRIRGTRTTALLEVELETGRKHQIRLQLAHRGHPILGDRKYGSRRPFPGGIALHSRRLELVHPVKGTAIDIVAPLPSCWKQHGIDG